jgi:ParB family chromosome partitioning protein
MVVTVASQNGKPLLRIEAKDRKVLRVTLLPPAGGTRGEAESALKGILDRY